VALKCLLAALKRVKDTVCNEQAETSFSGLSTQGSYAMFHNICSLNFCWKK